MFLNPFAILGATPRTPLAALLERAVTPETMAAARAVSVPRSRLTAEASLLPGVSDVLLEILAALRAGQRIDPAGLPPLAAANLRAHLCAAGLASADDIAGLAYAMPTGADQALIAAIDADRVIAGFSPCQPMALTAEIEALTEAHAAVLLSACCVAPDPAAGLVRLLEAGPGRPSPIMCRAVAAWTRRTATELGALHVEANAAVSAWERSPNSENARALAHTVRRWAAASHPQRLADVQAGLDHAPTVRALAPWRWAIKRVARDGQHAAAAGPAGLLTELFGNLPGEAVALRDEAREITAVNEAQTLGPLLEQLTALVTHLSADSAGLRAGLMMRPLGPTATQDAGELWAAFDAAASSSVTSEAPWDTVTPLSVVLDVPSQAGGEKAAAALFAGLIARADADGRVELAARLATVERAQQASAAMALYERQVRQQWLPLWLAAHRRRRVTDAIDRALHVVEDPADRRQLAAHRAVIRRRGRLAWGAMILLFIIGGGAFGTIVQLGREQAPSVPPPPLAPIPPAVVSTPTIPEHADEQMPGLSARRLTWAELRWCLANRVRLEAVSDHAPAEARDRLVAMTALLGQHCDGKRADRLDEEAVRADIAADLDRLRDEGDAMLSSAP